MIDQRLVAVIRQKTTRYPDKSPFHPPVIYPESPFRCWRDSTNTVYKSVRNVFRLLNLDSDNYDLPTWNPLGFLIRPGEKVVIKPNLISHLHQNKRDWDYVITHGSIIRAVLDYVYIALNGDGNIIIADAPQTDSNMDVIKEWIGIEPIQELFWKEKKFDVKFMDLRNEAWILDNGIYIETIKLKGDPLGNVRFDLNIKSFFHEVNDKERKYYGAFYDVEETNKHHSGVVHEYLMSRTVMESDVFISLPKLKTHKKVGVTLNLKGLVGINGDKNWLPHYAIGGPNENGDQFAEENALSNIENSVVLRAKKILLRKNRFYQILGKHLIKIGYHIFGDTEKVIRSGNWHGNDTCWRMVLDLNRIMLYGNNDGQFSPRPKRYFSVVDGVIGMDGNGPVAGKRFASGLIVGGANPLAVDVSCTKLMGFDYRKIPMLNRAFCQGPLSLSEISPDETYIVSNDKAIEGRLLDVPPDSLFRFEPHFGWKGHIEA